MPSPSFAKVVDRVAQFDFQYETVKYHPKIALSLAKAAKLAYCAPEDVIPFVKESWHFSDCLFLNNRESQAYLMANDQVIIVAFRGTSEAEDWTDDIKIFPPEADAFGKVHVGFQSALNLLWNHDYGNGITSLPDLIRSFQRQKPRSLWFTGHSLGAALATLATARLREKDVPVYGLYTYGSPRLGDRTFEQTFNADFKTRAFRFVNNNDMVTRVPTREMGFSHVGTFLYFDADGNLKVDPYFWLQFLDSLEGTADDLLKPGLDGINDHMIDQYLDHLAQPANQAIAL